MRVNPDNLLQIGYPPMGQISFENDNANGSQIVLNCKSVSHTLSTVGTTSTLTAFIPDGALVFALCARITTTVVASTQTTLAFGDGTVTFASKAALTANTTFDYHDAGSGQVPKTYAADTDLVLTVSGGAGNISAGVVRIVMWYWTVIPPQS